MMNSNDDENKIKFITSMMIKYEIDKISKDKRGEQPFSIDENILHSSAEGKVLEDPWVEAPDYVYTRSVSPEKAPDEAEEITIEFI